MKKNFTDLKNAILLICVLLMAQDGMAQRMTIAGWTFPHASTASVINYPADCGNGTLYLDGTHGSTEWSVGTNTGVNNSASYCMQGQNTSTSSENICGEAGNSNDKALGVGGGGQNGSTIVFAISTTGMANIMLNYSVRPSSSSSFMSAEWAHSIDGENYTTDTTLDYSNFTMASYNPCSVDFSNAEEINDQPTVYIRLTVSGATGGGSVNNRYDNLLFTGGSNVPTALQPVFSAQPGNHCTPFEVTMTSETENASIYYTTDGSEPDDVDGTLYTGAIAINSTTTLKAKAYADGLAASFVTSATYTLPTEISTISDFKILDGDQNLYILTCPVTAVYQHGSYLLVEDEAHTGLCIYGSLGATYSNGDVISGGICGVNKVYSNTNVYMVELSDPEFLNPTVTQGTAVEPVAVTMAQLHANWSTYDSRLVTVSGVTFAQGTISSNKPFLKIYQGNDSLGCANTFGTINSYSAPAGNANVTGIAFHHTNIDKIAPRGTSDIVDLLPSLTIVSPAEGLVIEQGTAVHVDLDLYNFGFENGSMIKGELLINGQHVTTQYVRSGSELAYLESMNLAPMMTEFGTYTFIASLVNADSTQFATPAVDSVHFTYQAITVAITTNASSLSFSATGESHVFTVSGSHLTDAIAITSDNSNFTVSPATLPATADNDTITVTFTGTESATGTLTLTSGTATATVSLNAAIAIDELILSVGFENSEGFSASQTYNNDNLRYFGPEGQQWGTIHGTVTTTDAMVGQQSMQLRYYGSTAATNTHLGHIGYAYTNFDIHNVTKVEFDAKSTYGSSDENNLQLRVSFSHDGGETFEGDSLYTPSTLSQHFTYFITDSGQYYSVRVKFEVVLPMDTPTNTVRLTIDAVDFYGVTGLEANVVETPVLSVPTGIYTTPQTVSINCATDGAAIYYTTDGTTPSTSSTRYESPITIDSTCTLKAKAFKGGMDPSNTAFAEYTFPVAVATIAEFKAAGANDNTATYVITGDVTFVYRQARRIFIEDTTGGLLVYDNSNPVVTGSYNEGDVISGGIVGTHTVYNGMQELVPTADWAAASGTATVTPAIATTADITENFATYEARLVRINAGTFSEEASFNTSDYTEYTLSDESGEIVVRNQFKTLDTLVNAGDTVDVIGLAAIYVTGGNTTYQIFPRTNADIIPLVTEPADTTDPGDTIGIHTFAPVILTVYPNPATESITVSADHDGGSLELLNAFGQVVYRAQAPVYPMTVNLSDKAAGLYFVRVITADRRIAVIKVTKE